MDNNHGKQNFSKVVLPTHCNNVHFCEIIGHIIQALMPISYVYVTKDTNDLPLLVGLAVKSAAK